MSDDYASRTARLFAAAATDPATIAAAQKVHEQQQKERRDWHTKRGNRVIAIRREHTAKRIEQLETQLDEMLEEWATLKKQLAAGRLSTEDYRKRARTLMEAREAIPDLIEGAVTDLDESTSELDPVQESARMLGRFPALAKRIGNSIPDLPESDNGSTSD